MHIIVLIRHVYFFAASSFHVCLAVAAGTALHANVPLVGVPVTMFLALLGVVILLGLLAFDLNRTRSGQAYFCFVCKIWFELALMTLLMVFHIATFFIVFSQNRAHPCLPVDSNVTDFKPCTALALIWAFQVLVTATLFLYVIYLGTVSILHYPDTPRVFSAAVRDFPWPKAPDPHNPVYFPNPTLPTFAQAFPDVHKKLEEGQARKHYPPHAHWSR